MSAQQFVGRFSLAEGYKNRHPKFLQQRLACRLICLYAGAGFRAVRISRVTDEPLTLPQLRMSGVEISFF
jgi:hypothetical protein